MGAIADQNDAAFVETPHANVHVARDLELIVALDLLKKFFRLRRESHDLSLPFIQRARTRLRYAIQSDRPEEAQQVVFRSRWQEASEPRGGIHRLPKRFPVERVVTFADEPERSPRVLVCSIRNAKLASDPGTRSVADDDQIERSFWLSIVEAQAYSAALVELDAENSMSPEFKYAKFAAAAQQDA